MSSDSRKSALEVLVPAELERFPVLAVGDAEAVLVVVRLVVHLAGVQRTIVALLELYGVRAALSRDPEQLLALLDVALVIVTHFGDDVAVARIRNLEAVDRESPLRHRCSPGHA
jgi:hypothetical protein